MEEIEKIIQKVIQENYSLAEEEKIEIKKSQSPQFGDYTTTIAMQLAKKLNRSPYELAQEIAKKIKELIQETGKTEKELSIDKIEAVKPGFINISFSEEKYLKMLSNMPQKWHEIAKFDQGLGKEIMIEYGQPNTHKAVLIGHLKSAISGLSLIRLHMNAGYKVIKANYFGDIGMQTAKCTWGALKKGIPQNEQTLTIKEKADYMGECYVYANKMYTEDEKSTEEIREINRKIYEGMALYYKGQKYEDESFKIYLKLREWSFEHQKDIWSKLGVEYDREYPESEIFELGKKIVMNCLATRSEDHISEDNETNDENETNNDEKDKNTCSNKVFEKDAGAIIFRGKNYGLSNWVYITKEGYPTYSGKDLGLAQLKMKEYPNVEHFYITTSVEQNAYFKALIKSIELVNPLAIDKFKHIPFGWLLQNGKKTSSRTGGAITAYDLIDKAVNQAKSKISFEKNYSEEEKSRISEKIGIGGLKFLILSHEFHKDINFNPDDMIQMEGFSGPYVMYGYSRAVSILRSAAEQKLFDSSLIDNLDKEYDDLNSEIEENEISKAYKGDAMGDNSCITTGTKDEQKTGTGSILSNSELDLLKALTIGNGTAKLSLKGLSAHGVCQYLYDLTCIFNKFYSECRVINEKDSHVRERRLRIVLLYAMYLKKFLWILGIETIDRM